MDCFNFPLLFNHAKQKILILNLLKIAIIRPHLQEIFFYMGEEKPDWFISAAYSDWIWLVSIYKQHMNNTQ